MTGCSTCPGRAVVLNLHRAAWPQPHFASKMLILPGISGPTGKTSAAVGTVSTAYRTGRICRGQPRCSQPSMSNPVC